ncbi:MAG: hypothetical protein ACKVQK_06885 [Burkholderiales bacterium]
MSTLQLKQPQARPRFARPPAYRHTAEVFGKIRLRRSNLSTRHRGRHGKDIDTVSNPNVEASGLMGYGADTSDNFRRTGLFMDKIRLRGAKPGDLPFEKPTRYYLTINGKTAKSLRVQLPRILLLQTDKVIE